MKILGQQAVKTGNTLGLPTYETENGVYVKVTNAKYKELSNRDAGLYNTICELKTVVSNSKFDILLWHDKCN